MSDTQTLIAARTPTVYFIDDSATIGRANKLRAAKFRASQSRRHIRMARRTRTNFRAATHRASTRASRSAAATRRRSPTVSRHPETAPRNPPPRTARKKTPGRTGSPKTVLRRVRS